MVITEYSMLSTEELIGYALLRDNRTPMEVELANRLATAVDMIEDMEDEADGNYARGESEESSKEVA